MTVLLLTVLASTAQGFPAGLPRITLEDDVAPRRPNGWLRNSAPELASLPTLELSFAVKQRHTHLLEDTLAHVSDPTSRFYGQHLSRDAVENIVKPEDQAVATVIISLSTSVLKFDSTDEIIICR